MIQPTTSAGADGAIDLDAARRVVAALWPEAILPALDRFARIPNLSPAFASDWAELGHMDEAVELLRAWCAARPIDGLRVDVVRLQGRTPTLVVEIPAHGVADADDDTVVLYGHLDKQPPFEGWRDGLGPFTPVREGDRLYARGVADDGYALFASLGAVEAVAAGGGRHARCVVMIEAGEESGSPDLAASLEHLADRIGRPGLVVALDSGCATFDRLWITRSLRGCVTGTLTARVLRHGVHSGMAGGVVPSSFQVVRILLDRIEDPATGSLRLPELQATPPAEAAAAAALTAGLAGEGGLGGSLPVTDDLRLLGESAADRELRASWGASLAVTGADGLPPTSEAGNVLRPFTALQLSVRVPPSCDAEAAGAALRRVLTADPPFGADVTFELDQAAQGWAAPAPADWLRRALDDASAAAFGAPPGDLGEGGSIPFLHALAQRWPEAQLVATGVLGPDTNAHGPNEYLHLPTAERVTMALAVLLDAHAGRR